MISVDFVSTTFCVIEFSEHTSVTSSPDEARFVDSIKWSASAFTSNNLEFITHATVVFDFVQSKGAFDRIHDGIDFVRGPFLVIVVTWLTGLSWL